MGSILCAPDVSAGAGTLFVAVCFPAPHPAGLSWAATTMSRNGTPSTGGGSGRGGGGANEYFVDPKLVFRIKQFVGEHHERGSVPTEDGAVDYLLDKFKEYVRKPQVCECVVFHGSKCLRLRHVNGNKRTNAAYKNLN